MFKSAPSAFAYSFAFSMMLASSALAAPAPVPPNIPEKATKPMVLAKSIESILAERIAKQLIAAAPPADPADTKARDAASEKLAACTDLIKACGDSVLWGGYNPAQGYDPDAYRLTDTSDIDFYQLTELNPIVWAKLYLSTFMFTGKYEIRKEGKFTVVALDATFRGQMDPGEYPYPFWHSPNKWTAYNNATQVLLVMEPGSRIVATLRNAPDPRSLQQIKKPWDAKWHWTTANGEEQPRVALYSYLFSKNNPHVADLDKSYRALEKHLRTQNCMLCHEPDNRGKINDLLLLDYPNQALTMRKTLVAILEGNHMPPGNALANEPSGVQDPATLAEMIKLAKEFEKNADQAFAFEKQQPAK